MLIHMKLFFNDKGTAIVHVRFFVARTLQLANLAPDIVKAIWENRQPVSLTLDKHRRDIPDSGEEQRKLFLGK